MNLGNGIQVVDSMLNRVGMNNELTGDSEYFNQSKETQGGIQIKDSAILRSTLGDNKGNSKEKDKIQFCSNCGTRLLDSDRFCTQCGTPLNFQ